MKIICSDTFLKTSELGFIRQVSSHIKKQTPPAREYSPRDVSYFRKSGGQLSGTYSDAVEVDVNAAYWAIALNFGYITEEIYNKAFAEGKNGKPKYSKTARLVALGAAAACKTHYVFDGKIFSPDESKGQNGVEEDKTGRNIFFHIATYLGELMDNAERAASIDLFFYWVDAFFVRASDAEKVKEYFKGFNLSVKVKELEYLKFYESPDGGPMAEAMEADGRRKTFNFPSARRRKRLIKNFKNDPKKW
jgi:hypothetical protein